MDAGEFREQDPALLLFVLYTAVVGSLTEASVLHAVVGKTRVEPPSAAERRRSSPSWAGPYGADASRLTSD
jgi:hypothetical protein